MKNKLNGAAFCSVLALGLLSDGLMDKLGPVGYVAVGGYRDCGGYGCHVRGRAWDKQPEDKL